MKSRTGKKRTAKPTPDDRLGYWASLARYLSSFAAVVTMRLPRTSRHGTGTGTLPKDVGRIRVRWARARMSPPRLVQLARDLQTVFDANEPRVQIHWGQSLRRNFTLKEVSALPLESLRRAAVIAITAENPTSGWSASVRLQAKEPGLTARVTGPAHAAQTDKDELAQQVKDAVELGNWNPISGESVAKFTTYAVGWGGMLTVVEFVEGFALILSLLVVVGVSVGAFQLALRLWPPIEIYAGEQTTAGRILKTAVPVLAGAASIVATALQIAGLGDD